jgi:ribonuclease D
MRQTTVAGAAFALMISMPFPAFAEPHPLQQKVQEQLDAAKATQEAAEKAKGSKRQQLIGEHIDMLLQTMQLMQTNKPQAGSNVQELYEWMSEQQKLMDEALQQMIKDQQLLKQARK